MNVYTYLFLIGLLASTLIEFWLVRRHVGSVRKHRQQVPGSFANFITLAQHQKAADYALAKARLAQFDMLYSPILLLLWTLGGGLDLLDQAWRAFAMEPKLTGIAVILSTWWLMTLLSLPLVGYSTFVIEQRFGFNRVNWKLFSIDFIKESLLTIILGIPLLWIILWIMEDAGTYWWLTAWLVWMGFVVLIQWVFPTLIAPIFNKFSPLEDHDLVDKITRLLSRCGFSTNGIFVMDGSTRSSHGNAYFSGFGNNKRIVFYDTILESLNPDEIEAVLAHELGHFKHRHILKRMLNLALMSLFGLALIAWLIHQEAFFHGLGVSQVSTHMAILLFILLVPIYNFLFQPVSAYISRRHEFQADDYAAKQSDAGDLINALVKLYKDNANTLTPDPLFSAYYDSHPPAPIRIAHLSSKIK